MPKIDFLNLLAQPLIRNPEVSPSFLNMPITLLSFGLWRNYYIKNVVLFEENSILLLPECFEASGVESVGGEVSQENPRNRGDRGKSAY